MKDDSFFPNKTDLTSAINVLFDDLSNATPLPLPSILPDSGLGEQTTIEGLAPLVLGKAAKLGSEHAFAHMDPPTPWITWVSALWNASCNQNMLHPDLSPVASECEQTLLQWLSPLYGMDGGHMTPGSTVSNLTALWAARELTSARKVYASDASHLSIAKSAHILGLEYHSLPTDDSGAILHSSMPDDVSDAILVLTAGTTSAGAIDCLRSQYNAAWTHVDAAWAGPLMLSQKYSHLLSGIEQADSVSISAHKWFFQPKESALILFKNNALASKAISFGGAYLASPNIGVLGSRSANAIPLLATFLAWGKQGTAARIDATMELIESLQSRLQQRNEVSMYQPNSTGVILWRVENNAKTLSVFEQLPQGAASTTNIDECLWIRQVGANPNVNIDKLWKKIERVLDDILSNTDS